MAWEIQVGSYPGVLLGARTYEYDSGHKDHCIYIPFIVLIITILPDPFEMYWQEPEEPEEQEEE